jgi:FkbM family methyltransferase
MNLYKINDLFYPHRVLDIGANIGQFRSEFSKVFPYSYIFSIEASSECEPFLKELTDNYYIGLLAKDNKEYNFYTRKNDKTCTGNSMYKELTEFYAEEHLEVEHKSGIMLDDLFEEESEFDLIKIDTQGSELDIITGGINLCKKAKAMILEVSLTQYNENSPMLEEVLNYMNSIGYYPLEILDEARNHGSHQQDILFINEKFISRSN